MMSCESIINVPILREREIHDAFLMYVSINYLYMSVYIGTMGLQDIIAGLADNPYFGAGFGLFGLGAAAAVARQATGVGMVLFRRHFVTTVEVTCKDKSYPWLLQWISEKGSLF